MKHMWIRSQSGRWTEETDYILPEERLYIVQELAWEMYEHMD